MIGRPGNKRRQAAVLTRSVRSTQNKGGPRRDRRRGPLRFAAAPTQPVGGIRTAAPGYHYTLDHLLTLEPPWSVSVGIRREPPGLVPVMPRSHDPITSIVDRLPA